MWNAEQWIAQLQRKIRSTFGARLRFIGLQGSYRRGEATKHSDIDLVVILDELHLADLAAYRCLVKEMPHPEKACGFVSGEAELRAWPKNDLFQFYHDTEPLYGSLDALIPEISRQDVEEAVRIQSANLYHAACHSYLFEEPQKNLPSLFKSVFFLLQAKAFLQTGRYAADKAALAPLLSGEDADIFRLAQQKEFSEEQMERHYDRLIQWAGNSLLEQER